MKDDNEIFQPIASIQSNKRRFFIEPALGEVLEVTAIGAVVALKPNEQSGSDGATRIGEILIIETHHGAAIGQVISLKNSVSAGSVLAAEIRLLSSLDVNNGVLTSGVSQVPFVGAQVYIPHPDLVRALIEDRKTVSDSEDSNIRLSLARTTDSHRVELSFLPERLFGRHLAILGSSGSGKSWSVARLIEQCSNFSSKVILLDPTGEYEPLNGGVFHLHLGAANRETRSLEASLPYRELTEADLVAIFRPVGGSQIIKLRSAIKTLKLLQLEPRLATEGTFPKGHKSKVTYEAAYNHHRAAIESLKNSFDITKLPLQLELECVDPNRSSVEPSLWGGVNSFDQSQCIPLINRITDILNSSELASIFNPGRQPSVFDAMNRFFRDPKVSVLRVSLEFLPATHRVREIIANSIGRYLLALGRSNAFKGAPLLTILDEAHQALSAQHSDMSSEFPLEAFNIIAKEGRKYGLTLCLATQRPRDIPDDVLSQMGTFFVHRLVNDADRNTVERASGAMHKSVLDNLPSMASGEAFILGIDFPNPIRVKMEPPVSPPNSAGPDYQRLWKLR